MKAWVMAVALVATVTGGGAQAAPGSAAKLSVVRSGPELARASSLGSKTADILAIVLPALGAIIALLSGGDDPESA